MAYSSLTSWRTVPTFTSTCPIRVGIQKQHTPLLYLAVGFQDQLRQVSDLPLLGEALPALHVASAQGDEDMVDALLRFCNATRVDITGRSPLHHAAIHGHPAVIDTLLSAQGPGKPLDPDMRTPSGWTPLTLAASGGHKATVRQLIRRGANVKGEDGSNKMPLIAATIHGHTAVIELLLRHGADITAQDANRYTALTYAMAIGSSETLLLST
ncbi:ankyrin repeat-containing domain protein [Aspergillus aurantiobrunneus]